MAEPLRVHHGKLHYYVREIFKRLRVPPKDASRTADVIVAAELYGIESEGVARLPFYVDRISGRLVNTSPRIKVVHEEPATATLDGDNGLGPVVACRAMELALIKAERTGMAAVAVRRSNHFGPAGYYARLALPREMIGLALTNAYPNVVPHSGAPPLVGANPIAIAAPALSGRPFVLDMSTSTAAPAKIEAAKRRSDEIPGGWALDAGGAPTRDPTVALKSQRLLPLGSGVEAGGYKGFGLAVAVDILCGVLSGGAFGLELSGASGGRPGVAKIGHFFAAIKVSAFGSYRDFLKRNEEMLKTLADPPGPRSTGFRTPGAREHETEQERRANGILLRPEIAKDLERVGRGLGLLEAWEQLRVSRREPPTGKE